MQQFASQNDMVLAYGEREVIQFTDRDLQGVIDATVLADAIDLATQEINAYIGSRYVLPLASVPRLLTQICCDITRYRLCGAEAQETDPVRVRYRDAVKVLEKISAGTMTLGLDQMSNDVGTEETVRIINGRRIFNQNELADY